jgi:hypothetical protein
MAGNEGLRMMNRLFTVALCCMTFTIIACAATKQRSTASNSANPQANINQTSGAQANDTKADKADAMDTKALKLTPHKIPMAGGKSLTLNLPSDFDIVIAAQGLKRPRFFAKSPDNRIFLTTMYNRADNRRGAVYILDEFDQRSGQFKKVIPYLKPCFLHRSGWPAVALHRADGSFDSLSIHPR